MHNIVPIYYAYVIHIPICKRMLIFLLIIYNILIYNISAPKIIPTPICPFLMKKLKEVISLYDSSITPRAKG